MTHGQEKRTNKKPIIRTLHTIIDNEIKCIFVLNLFVMLVKNKTRR